MTGPGLSCLKVPERSWHNPRCPRQEVTVSALLDVYARKEGSLVKTSTDAAIITAPSPSVITPSPLAADLIWGVGAIAEELGVNRRKTYFYLQSGAIPGTKIGAVWVASRNRLRERFLGEAA